MSDTIKLWTHHPSTFPLDDPHLNIDATKGKFWKQSEWDNRGYRYQQVLQELQRLLGTKEFIWCCTKRGQFIRVSQEIDLVEWELNVPLTQVLRFYREQVWEDLLYSRTDDWMNLLLDELATRSEDNIGALVHVPLKPEWVTRHEMTPEYPKARHPSTRRRRKTTE